MFQSRRVGASEDSRITLERECWCLSDLLTSHTSVVTMASPIQKRTDVSESAVMAPLQTLRSPFLCALSRLLFRLAAVLLILAGTFRLGHVVRGVSPAHSAHQARADAPLPLRSQPLKSTIAGTEVHSYELALQIGQYAHIIVDQGIVDLAVGLFAPNGERLEEVDGRWHGPESVSVLASESGSYQLRVRSVLGSETPRSYSVTVLAIRPPGEDDKQRMLAERLATTAKPLLAQPTSASLKTALQTYQRVLSIWRTLGDRFGEAQALKGVVTVFVLTGDLDSALAPLETAEKILRDLMDPAGEAETLNLQGFVRSRKGQKRQAVTLYERALSLQRDTGSAAEIAALSNLGSVHMDLGEAEKALEYFKRTLPLAEAARQRINIQQTLNNLGTAYDALGQPQQALDLYDRATALCREAQDVECATALTLNSGTLRRRLGDAQRALQLYGEAAESAKTLPNPRLYGLAVQNVGTAHQELGQQDKALAHFHEALLIFQKIRDVRLEGVAHIQIGEIHRQQKAYDVAVEHLQKGLALVQAAGDVRNEAQAQHLMGRVQQALGDSNGAMMTLRSALALARATKDVHNEAQMLLSLGNVERDSEKLPDAIAHFDAALQLIEGLRARVSRQPLRTALLASKQDYYESYIDALMRRHIERADGDLAAQALEVSDRAKARSLMDLLNEAGTTIREGVDASLLDRERSLRHLLNGKSDRQLALLSAKQTTAALELGREIDETIAGLQAVEADIRSRSPQYAALTQPQFLTAEDLRREVLADDTALIEFSLGREQSYVWVLTTTGLASAKLPTRTTIEQASRELYQALTARSQQLSGETAAAWVERIRSADAQWTRLAAQVSQKILSPVAASLTKRRLLIVTDGALSYLPFGVLPDPNASDSRPLIADHEIVTAPSASVLAILRRDRTRHQTPPSTVAILADPVFDVADSRVRRRMGVAQPGSGSRGEDTDLARAMEDVGFGSSLRLNRLLGSRDEASLIQSFAPRAGSVAALDFEANLTMATSPTLARHRIVHFATHTLINTRHPELSGIVLSLVDRAGNPQPGFLRLHDIFNLQLPVELVVLSACQTALGQELRGEGLVGLSRGFMYAGAPRVVASLWKVDDKATSVLMGHFYREMLRGKWTPAAALRRAQQQMKDDRDWSHPFHWAGFVIQGEWR